jgi:predicted nucleic acid-binding protein
MRRVILDAGPLVAWFCPRDEHHSWARRIFSELAPGSLICEAVLTEVCHLVFKEGVSQVNVVESVAAGGLIPVSLSTELLSVASFLKHYADSQMDFADACVLRLAEMNPQAAICTVDSQFRFFRKNTRDPLLLIAPFAS